MLTYYHLGAAFGWSQLKLTLTTLFPAGLLLLGWLSAECLSISYPIQLVSIRYFLEPIISSMSIPESISRTYYHRLRNRQYHLSLFNLAQGFRFR